jgi:hypothetical protein
VPEMPRDHRYAKRLQFSRNLRESVAAAGDKHQIVTVVCEKFREFISDAARCPGDENSRHADILERMIKQKIKIPPVRRSVKGGTVVCL